MVSQSTPFVLTIGAQLSSSFINSLDPIESLKIILFADSLDTNEPLHKFLIYGSLETSVSLSRLLVDTLTPLNQTTFLPVASGDTSFHALVCSNSKTWVHSEPLRLAVN
eukprot:Blabericola_migrator_1__7938@NODE_406_length_8824_cov_44_431426_g320_i0_p7_GENE_NODE_406_length_8824_cov_44_431426_g320_i0NODE_406_length_8824_cov_44_431426_g320_i0_p7_ORF_typecomplete_len109_score14_89_NODE_406_length_8824_cov_44_431426_g320_i044254751